MIPTLSTGDSNMPSRALYVVEVVIVPALCDIISFVLGRLYNDVATVNMLDMVFFLHSQRKTSSLNIALEWSDATSNRGIFAPAENSKIGTTYM